LGSLQTVEAGHCDIQNHHIGIKFPNSLDGILTVRRFSTDLPLGVRLEKRTQASTEDLVIIGN
jgi:hypothetical protein